MDNRLVLEAAIVGLESKRREIDELLYSLKNELNGFTPATTTKKRPGLPPKTTSPASESAPVKPKRKLSAAGRKAIRDAVKRRWAAKRAADKAAKKSA